MSRYKKFDVVIVPFPFADLPKAKKRPAVVLSSSEDFAKTNHTVLAMVTSAKNEPWPLDCPVVDLKSAGLPAPSVVRMKLFTIDNTLIQGKVGELSQADAKKVHTHVSETLGFSK